MSSGYLTRSRYQYECTIRDNKIGMEADVYFCKTPIRMTIDNVEGHRGSHGLGNNPGSYVNEKKCDTIFVMRSTN